MTVVTVNEADTSQETIWFQADRRFAPALSELTVVYGSDQDLT